MRYEDAINKLINTYGFDILNDKFITHSLLSDFVGNDIYGKRLLTVFLDIYNLTDIYSKFKTLGLIEGRKYFNSLYLTIKDKYTKIEFRDSLNPISRLICINEYNNLNKPHTSCHTHKIVIVKAKPEINSKKNNTSINLRTSKQINRSIPKSTKKVVALAKPNIQAPIPSPLVIYPKKTLYSNLKKAAIPKGCSIVDINKLMGISVIASDTNLLIRTCKTNDFRFTTSKSKVKLNPVIATMINDILYLDLRNYHVSTMCIELPQKYLNLIKITGSNLYLSIETTNYKVGKIFINTNNSNINVNMDSELLKINNNYGNICIVNAYDDINIFNTNGSIRYRLKVKNKDEMKFKITNIKGNVYGCFEEGKVMPNLNLKLSNSKEELNTKGKLYHCIINFDFKIKGGMIIAI